MSKQERPTPDPSWDYTPVWQELCEMESKLDEILNFLQKQEESNSSTDSQLLFHLGYLDGKLDNLFDSVSVQVSSD